jgi:hypothetical protein
LLTKSLYSYSSTHIIITSMIIKRNWESVIKLSFFWFGNRTQVITYADHMCSTTELHRQFYNQNSCSRFRGPQVLQLLNLLVPVIQTGQYFKAFFKTVNSEVMVSINFRNINASVHYQYLRPSYKL